MEQYETASMQKEYTELCRIKREIDEKLADWDEQTIAELLEAFRQDEVLKRLTAKDNQLIKLKCLCILWMDETMKRSMHGVESTILKGIQSLHDAELRFLTLQFGMLRIACQMPEEKCEEVIDYIIRYDISGIVLYFMLKSVTENYQQSMKRLVTMLNDRKQYVTAACLLKEAGAEYEKL